MAKCTHAAVIANVRSKDGKQSRMTLLEHKSITLVLVLLISTYSLHAQTPDTSKLQQVVDKFKTLRLDEKGKGVAWDMTQGNLLPNGWIVTTEGKNGATPFVDALFNAVLRAKKSVDVIMLGPPPGKGDEIWNSWRNVLRTLNQIAPGPISVRIAFGGQITGKENVDINPFLGWITSDIKGPTAKVSVSVGMVRSDQYSWNHAKIVVVDDSVAIVGGHNMYALQYWPTSQQRVADLSMQVEGPAAITARNFTQMVWHYICDNNKHHDPRWKTYASTFTAAGGIKGDSMSCKNQLSSSKTLSPAETNGAVPILAVSRVGSKMVDYNIDYSSQWSDVAMEELLRSAKDVIRLSQQDIGYRLRSGSATAWPDERMKIIDNFIRYNSRLEPEPKTPRDVFIVLSNYGAWNDYANNVTAYHVLERFKTLLQDSPAADLMPRVSEQLATTLVCKYIHLSTYAEKRGDMYLKEESGRGPLGNHAKFYMIDDDTFYIGSHNIYPQTIKLVGDGSLQEFGYIVQDASAASTILNNYWNPIWEAATHVRVSGRSMGPSDPQAKCILDNKTY